MTPADELAAAADKLDALIAAATDGDWSALAMLGAETGSDVLAVSNDAPAGWSSVAHGISDADAAYIAAMNPLVGKALAEWLRAIAAWPKHITGTDREFGLRIARLINGGAE